MSGSPPQMETIGASHSWAEARQSSRVIMSLRLVEYSRMRPQPVQVRLQVCSGSSCRTSAKRGVRRILCVMMWRAIFAVNARGNRIGGVFRTERLQLTALLRERRAAGLLAGDEPGAAPAAGQRRGDPLGTNLAGAPGRR